MSASRLGIWTLVIGLGLLPPNVSLGQSSEEEYRTKVLAVSKKIDDLIYAKQKEAGVKVGDKAGDGTYFRRMNIDLIGRIPTLQDIDDFLADEREDKRWVWVEKMLAHERVPAHLAAVYRHRILGAPNQMTAFQQPQFEEFLKQRFQKNVGYDKIVHEVLSSGATTGDPRLGGGFSPGGMAANPSIFFFANENKPENLAATTTRVFLGVKLECAQCHAHPTAKWTKEQFWEFAAFYSGRARFAPRVPVPGMPVAPLPKPGEIEIPGTKKIVKARFLDGAAPDMDEAADPQKVLADWLSSPKNPYFPKATADFIWSTYFGVSLLEPIIEPNEDAPITHPEILDLLARELVESKFDLRHLMRIIVHTDAYQRASTGKGKADPDDYNLFVRMPVRGMTPEQLFDSFVEATTDEIFPKSMSGPGFPMSFGGPLSPRAEFLTRFATQDRRHETQTSILQALFLMNGKFVNDLTDPAKNKSLKHVITLRKGDNASKIRTFYKLVLSRLPRPEELDRLVRYVNEGGPTHDQAIALTDVYWALLNSGEFMLNH